ncbi:MAG: calcium-binding protein [Pseudomonadota bacterium]
MTKQTLFRTLPLAAALLATTALTAVADGHASLVKIGETTALVAEASTADDPAELVNGQSADTDFPYISRMKALATVGEVDATTGDALTGWPDGHAAWLTDEDTVRIAYQSESYATMSTETYGWEMTSGVKFTGSHLHFIDYDRSGLAEFMGNDDAASTMVKGSGHVFSTIYNVFGDEVLPKSEGGVWGNQVLPDGTHVDFAPDMMLNADNADFFFQSFCGAFYEQPHKWGEGIGFEDHIYMMAEEWKITSMFNKGSRDEPDLVFEPDNGMGLASLVVDIANETAYTAPALGQTGYEKIMPINSQHPDYVVLVLSGYNHDREPAPLKIYVGRKGADVNGTPISANAPERDQFLARNGLLHGKIYGMAVANALYGGLGIDEIDTESKMLDDYMTDPDAADSFPAMFVPTSYQWGGWDNPVAVKDTEMNRWQMPSEQPLGHTFFVGDSKVEHPMVDPDVSHTRWAHNLTNKGGVVAITLPGILAELEAADGALPEALSASVVRTLAAVDGALTLDVASKGIKHGGEGTHATWEDGRAQVVAPDGGYWVKASNADVLIIDEDSGNDLGERKLAVVVDPETMKPTEMAKGYFLAMAGGGNSPRAAAGATALGGAIDKPRTSEFSGTWSLTGLLSKKDDGSFYTMDELAGTGLQEVAGAVPINDQMLMGVVQHRTASGGQVKNVQADRGGQIFMFQLNLPDAAM